MAFRNSSSPRKGGDKRKYQLYRVHQNPAGQWRFVALTALRKTFLGERQWIEPQQSQSQAMLLWIHGTYSTASQAFGPLLEDAGFMEELKAKYGDRILAFNHRTLLRSVAENADYLKGYLTLMGEGKLDLDILTTSRGGLVARYLIEQAELPPHITIRKLIMQGCPNQGSQAAYEENYFQTARVRNLLLRLNQSLMAAQIHPQELRLKDLVWEKMDWQGHPPILNKKVALPGVRDISPHSSLLKALNEKPVSTLKRHAHPAYFSIATVFDPADKRLKMDTRFRAQLIRSVDGLFQGEPSDGIVPVKSAFGEWEPRINGFSLNLTDSFLLADAPEINHTNYPSHPRVRAKILEYLFHAGE